MLHSPRQQEILAALRAGQAVSVEALAERFGVSAQTIRADLRRLSSAGLVERTHGGARAASVVQTRAYAQRRRDNAEAKARIALAAARLVPNDCSVMLNIGTTTEQVARALAGHSGLLVISNNINIATLLMGAPLRELVLVGGTVRPEDGAVVGPEAVEFLSRYKVDIAIIGASALDEEGDILDYDAREVSVARAILRNARRRILVCDHSKFACRAPVRIAHVSGIDQFVTDAPPPEGFARAAAEAGTEIILAGESADG